MTTTTPTRSIELVACTGCGDLMNARRLDPDLVPITKGVCSECVCAPIREAKRVEREMRVAAFGEGRC